ncbi:Clp protease N-terminal domain-containing protein [Engelhardtia mirabilis]|uniref:ATP-dependent Clp protease ATP-binding subunit ClpC1 n=1 Tax=Engelhardtia mirabilis TaxID=2528011 RepID=A0A518BKX1_9BACT|nr:ATP-dependent Clp protease ATP-binding subunit ClpC1 [Planctomycetes bacterium Pla133]QDV01945.1 ATP-dependent Clp protease ATP-binding subunit ClpC1 [Planctomycetes bacterium Pla86]
MSEPQPQPQQRSIFDLFDDEARQAVQVARDEVARTKRNAIGPEHLTTALLKLDGAQARKLVDSVSIDAEAWVAAIDELAGVGTVEEPPQQLPFTPRGQQTMQVLVQIATSMAHDSLGSAHLLLANLQDPEGLASKGLERVSGDREALGKAIIDHLQTLPQNEQMKAQAEAMRKAQAAQQAGGAQPAARAGAPMGGGSLSPAAQRVLQAAGQQAQELRHTQIGTVHLLLALVTDPDRMTHNIFVKLGLRPEDVRSELLGQLRAESAGNVAAQAAAEPSEAESSDAGQPAQA